TGDVILEVDGRAVRNVDELRSAMEQIGKARKQFVVMKILRGIHTRFLEFEPKWPQEPEGTAKGVGG
ncbi:MAG TPA: hypothetical protein VKM56_07660, partial [Verrucomicrobiae bacterium]|nr:hypothetical protein [Verrucomicrobiae bacterium]